MLAFAMATLVLISIAEPPSFGSVSPRFLKAVTSSSFWTFMLICGVVFSQMVTMTLFFSLQTCIPYNLALLDNLSVRCCSSLLLPFARPMSSANLRLLIVRPSMEIEDMKLCNVSLIMFSKYMLNSTRDSRQSWRTPTFVLKYSQVL